jgi:hypothetical protein
VISVDVWAPSPTARTAVVERARSRQRLAGDTLARFAKTEHPMSCGIRWLPRAQSKGARRDATGSHTLTR